MNTISPNEFENYFKAIEEESKQYTRDGAVSYPYVAGVLQAMLKDAFNDNFREIVEATIKDTAQGVIDESN